MPNEIKDKFGSSTALTLTAASLASSAAGVGRQSTIVDNTTTRYQRVVVYVKLTVGTTPTADKTMSVYLIRDDNNASNHRTDGAGATDAGLTIKNAQLIGVINVDAATSDTPYHGEFVVDLPGPKWGIAIVHDTAVNLNATGSNHWVRYVGSNPEVQ